MLHQSVLLHEVVGELAVKAGETYVDGTLGLAGHARAVFISSNCGARVIGFDRDISVLTEAKTILEQAGCTPLLFNTTFSAMKTKLEESGIASVDAILLDLGVSSVQLDTEGRGFSFLRDEPLTMTMEYDSTTAKLTAADLVNNLGVPELRTIITNYGEERYAHRIAEAIVRNRDEKPITTTGQLADIIKSAVPALYRHGRIHPATKTFQALRIAVNNELGELETGLRDGDDLLAPGGRFAIITFHSLEDRMVKHFFREKVQEGALAITRKPIVGTEEEINGNRRARSAKLRIIRKA